MIGFSANQPKSHITCKIDATEASSTSIAQLTMLCFLLSSQISKSLPYKCVNKILIGHSLKIWRLSSPAPWSWISHHTSSISPCNTSKCFICATEAMQQKGGRMGTKVWRTPIQNCEEAFLSYVTAGGKTKHFHRFLPPQAIAKQMSQTAPLLSLQDAEQLCRRLGCNNFNRCL